MLCFYASIESRYRDKQFTVVVREQIENFIMNFIMNFIIMIASKGSKRARPHYHTWVYDRFCNTADSSIASYI